MSKTASEYLVEALEKSGVKRGLDRRIEDIWGDVRGYARDVSSGTRRIPNEREHSLHKCRG